MADYTIPSDVIISNVEVTHNIPNLSSESISLITKTKGRGLHRLEGNFDVTVGESIQAQKTYQSFLIKCKGRLNTFEIDLPTIFKSELSSNPVLTVAAGIGNTTISLSSFNGGTIYAGSCFTMLNDSKVYYVENDISRSGGVATIFPPLRQTQLINSVVNFISPVITARFSEDMQTVIFSESGGISEATINWKEAL